MGMKRPSYRGLLGRECHAFFKGLSGCGDAAMSRKRSSNMKGEKEEDKSDQQRHFGGRTMNKTRGWQRLEGSIEAAASSLLLTPVC